MVSYNCLVASANIGTIMLILPLSVFLNTYAHVRVRAPAHTQTHTAYVYNVVKSLLFSFEDCTDCI